MLAKLIGFAKKYKIVLLAIGIFFFIPDPTDALFGIGTIVQALAGILGIVGVVK